MKICEATTLRIQELRKEKRMTVYSLIYQSGMPASTVREVSPVEKVKIRGL